MGKPPKVLRILKNPYWEEMGEYSFGVCITRYQALKLPYWVQEKLNYDYDEHNLRHIWIRILAKDELQAMMRFNKLWAGLPKE